MCGIVGVYDLTGKRTFPTEQLIAMMDALEHRGPDDANHLSGPGIAMGIRRLSIIDIAQGRQPFKSDDDQIWSTQNGEIFNHIALREELSKDGFAFKTLCDSEIWIPLYTQHRADMFIEAKGQFAVALWDKREQTLFLGRDRVGICPLYFAKSDGWLLWSSEIKPLFASGLITPEPDRKGLDYQFNFFSTPFLRTCFAGVKLLYPGYFLKVARGEITSHQYWDFEFPDKGHERTAANPELLLDELDGLLKQAVDRRLMSDVPVVSYLSGGIDSAMVLNVSKRLGHTLPTFSISMVSGSGPNENSYAAQTAKLHGSKQTVVPVDTAKLTEVFPEFIKAAEGPVLDPSCAALMCLAKEIGNQGYKVALTGEGSDEAFAGYYYFRLFRRGQALGQPFLSMLYKLVNASIHRAPRRNRHRDSNPITLIRPAQQLMYESLGLAHESLYSDRMWDALSDYNPYSELNLPVEKMQRWSPLNQSIYTDYKHLLAGLLLVAKGDRIAMHSSVETRFPFLDEDVIAFCSSISPDYKLNKLKEKWLLRQLAARTLPKEIAERPKLSFQSILSGVFLGDERPRWVDQLLSPESIRKAGYFDPIQITKARTLIDKYPKITPRQRVMDAVLVSVISTQLWHHLFFNDDLCEVTK